MIFPAGVFCRRRTHAPMPTECHSTQPHCKILSLQLKAVPTRPRGLQCQPNRLYIASSNPLPTLAGPPTAAQTNNSSPLSLSPPSTALKPSRRISTTSLTNTSDDTSSYQGFPWRTEVDFLNNDHSTHTMLKDTIFIEESGVYSMWFVICDPKQHEVRPMADAFACVPRSTRRFSIGLSRSRCTVFTMSGSTGPDCPGPDVCWGDCIKLPG